jgi:hypothetical protein
MMTNKVMEWNVIEMLAIEIATLHWKSAKQTVLGSLQL